MSVRLRTVIFAFVLPFLVLLGSSGLILVRQSAMNQTQELSEVVDHLQSHFGNLKT